MSKKALIVIDMQEGFRYPETEAIIPDIITEIKRFEGLVIFTQFFDAKNSLFERQLKWNKFQKEENQKILKELDKYDKIVFRHFGYTAIASELIEFLKKGNVKQTYLAGIYTDVSVLKSAMDLFDHGFEVFVLRGACASVHQDQNHNLHESGLESISHVIGQDHVI